MRISVPSRKYRCRFRTARRSGAATRAQSRLYVCSRESTLDVSDLPHLSTAAMGRVWQIPHVARILHQGSRMMAKAANIPERHASKYQPFRELRPSRCPPWCNMRGSLLPVLDRTHGRSNADRVFTGQVVKTAVRGGRASPESLARSWVRRRRLSRPRPSW